MADDCTMELFFRAAAGSPLEVKHTVRTMCNRLQSRKSAMPGRFCLEIGCQLVKLGLDSISRKGWPLMERITSCHRAKSAAASTLPSLRHWG